MKRLLAALALVCVPLTAHGFEIDTPLADLELEARAQELAKGFRCLVCQNQSILDSDADLARDMRQVVRERVAAGASDAEVRDYLVQRYGDFVLLKPPFKPKTYLLWLGPAVIVVLAGLGVGIAAFRRRPAGSRPAPLSEEERARLAALLDQGEERGP